MLTINMVKRPCVTLEPKRDQVVYPGKDGGTPPDKNM